MSNLVINYEIKEISRKNSRILYDDTLSGKKTEKEVKFVIPIASFILKLIFYRHHQLFEFLCLLPPRLFFSHFPVNYFLV